MTTESLYYALANGTDIVPVGPERVLFRSDVASLALEGGSAVVLAERILPMLDGQRSLAEIAATLPNLDVTELSAHLDALVDARVLVRGARPRDRSAPAEEDGFLGRCSRTSTCRAALACLSPPSTARSPPSANGSTGLA
jgi:hypothetical protein